MIKKLFRTLCIIFIPIVNNQQLYIVQEPWFPTISNVNFCLLKNNIDVHIPFRTFKSQKDRLDNQFYSKQRRNAIEKFDKTLYNKRALAESVNSAIKQTLGGFVRARTASNQQKTVTIKALAYNIEHIGHIIKISILMEIQ